MSQKIRVLVVDDEILVSEAIVALLEMEAGITVVGQTISAEMCLQQAHSLRPDVILLDLHLPDHSGAEIISLLLEDNPNVCIVILTGHATDEEFEMAFRAGAVGCVLKTQAPSMLVQAIENAYNERSSVPPRDAKFMLQMINPNCTIPEVSALSKAEYRILIYVARGLGNKDIAQHLHIKRRTVHAHVSHILSKLKLENRTQLAVFAVKHGLVSLDMKRQIAPSASSFERPGSSTVYATPI